MKEKLTEVLKSFANFTESGYDYYPPSEGSILEALIEVLKCNGFVQYIYNGCHFEGGPAYDAEYFVLTWFEDNSLHSIDWMEECF